MSIQPFTVDELEFAWCHRLYLRFRTHRRRVVERLRLLDRETLSGLMEMYNVHVLEVSGDCIDLRVLASLTLAESVSAAASKIKGRISKWLSDHCQGDFTYAQQRWLGRGYFASTTGKSTSVDVAAYLDRQAEHHGYDRRARPPVFVQKYEVTDREERLLATEHAVTSLRYHLVLATPWRRGVFSQESASAVTGNWRAQHTELKAVIQKVSFVPDHVHIAVELHPTVSPAAVVVRLMNSAQDMMRERFWSDLIRAKVDRLWQASAYMGSFGDLRSAAVATYVRNWEKLNE
jgi:REP element-mobilizing transposase RayT